MVDPTAVQCECREMSVGLRAVLQKMLCTGLSVSNVTVCNEVGGSPKIDWLKFSYNYGLFENCL